MGGRCKDHVITFHMTHLSSFNFAWFGQECNYRRACFAQRLAWAETSLKLVLTSTLCMSPVVIWKFHEPHLCFRLGVERIKWTPRQSFSLTQVMRNVGLLQLGLTRLLNKIKSSVWRMSQYFRLRFDPLICICLLSVLEKYITSENNLLKLTQMGLCSTVQSRIRGKAVSKNSRIAIVCGGIT